VAELGKMKGTCTGQSAEGHGKRRISSALGKVYISYMCDLRGGWHSFIVSENWKQRARQQLE